MNEWMVVTVIATLIGICASVIRPLIRLNGTITKLTAAVNVLEKNISELAAKNSESHAEIWEKVEEHDDVLNSHETRLVLIENNTSKYRSERQSSPTKDFSYMYRNCPEHPVIKEILKSGDAIRLEEWISNTDNDRSELELRQVFYLTEQDFAEICSKRKI